MAKAKPAESSTKQGSLINNLALGALIAELVGSFILAFAVLNTGGNAIVAGITVLVLVLALSKLSGGHINPAVTVSLFVTKQIGWKKMIAYLLAQFIGAMLAVVVASAFIAGNASTDPNTGLTGAAKIYSVAVTGTWKPFFAEFVGAIVFGLGIASVAFGKKEGYEAAFTIGGALLIGLIIATAGSSAILNPAVALSVGALDPKNMWGLIDYALAPILGASIGALLYRLLQMDLSFSRK